MSPAFVGRRGVVVALLAATAPLAAQEDGDARARQVARETYVAQRADASGRIPPGKMFDLWRQVVTLPMAQADAAWRSVGPAGLWINQDSFGGLYGGEMKSGRINAIAFHPTDSRAMYIGSMGGVWRTSNSGASWTGLTDRQCTMTIGDVIVDPINPAIVYAGTGDGNGREQTGCGVLRSTDGGTTWAPPAPSALVDTYIYELEMDRRTAGSPTATTLFAATSGGLFASTNSGTTWALRVPGNATAVVADATRPGVFFASISWPSEVPRTTLWRSVNGGLNWARVPTPLSSPSIDARMELATSPAAPGMVFALAGDMRSWNPLGLFRWNDIAGSWTELNAAGVAVDGNYPFIFGQQAGYDLALAVDPRDANRIWIAGVGAYLSTDGGATFRITATNIHVDWHAITFSPSEPDVVAAGTDGGIYLSHDGGRTWRARNQGLAITQVYPGMAVHPAGLWVYAGLQDNNAIYFSGSSVWGNLSLLGDGGFTVINRNDPATVWVTHSFENYVMRQARGVKEEDRSNGINFSDRRGKPRPLIMDPTSPSTLYFGTHRVYRTTDEGLNWAPITTDMTRGTGYITSLAISPVDSRVIWLATSDGVLAGTTDGGNSWTRLLFGTLRHFTRVLIDPADPRRIIATASTFGAPKITESRDGGATFSAAIGGNLPDLPVHNVAQIPGSSQLFAATDYGVLQSQDGGTTWTQGPAGMPTSIVHDLVWVQSTGTLYAGTFGRGVFAFRPGITPPVMRGDVNRDGRLTAQDALIVQQALAGVEIAGSAVYPEGDANCDNQLSIADALFILRSAVGLPSPGVCVGTTARIAARAGAEEAVSRSVIAGVGTALR